MTSPSYATLRALHPGPPEGSAGFSLLTWNVLADALAESGGFVRAPQGSLAWEARRDALLGLVLAGEGSGRAPDVVCLQEVDRFADAFEPALRSAGYASLFVPKADGRDGCCLAFRRERFALRWAEPRRYLDAHGQNQVQHALLVALDDLRGEPPLLVATTHFKAKLEHAALRAAQARQLGGWARAAQARLGPDARLVVAGDLNDVPESAALAALRAVGLESAYAACLGAEAAWTTWKVRAAGEVRRTIDYALFDPQRLAPRAVLLPPPEDAIDDARLPSPRYPSDHLALWVHFGAR